MNVELQPTEVVALRDLVEARLVNLSSEIRHTDSPQMRSELRDLREVLRAVRSRLHPQAA